MRLARRERRGLDAELERQKRLLEGLEFRLFVGQLRLAGLSAARHAVIRETVSARSLRANRDAVRG
jgi:hypothetical protein